MGPVLMDALRWIFSDNMRATGIICTGQAEIDEIDMYLSMLWSAKILTYKGGKLQDQQGRPSWWYTWEFDEEVAEKYRIMYHL